MRRLLWTFPSAFPLPEVTEVEVQRRVRTGDSWSFPCSRAFRLTPKPQLTVDPVPPEADPSLCALTLDPVTHQSQTPQTSWPSLGAEPMSRVGSVRRALD